MAKMKTLTINGQRYIVDDPDAVQAVNADDSIPEAGTVPIADGNGGATWEKPASGGGTFYVTITDSEPDKTVDELLEAYNNGMTLVCLNKYGGASMVYNLYGVNTDDKQVVFFFVYAFDDEAITIATITFTEDGISTGTVSITEGDSFPPGGEVGQALVILDDGTKGWATISGGTSTIPSAEGVGF